MKSQDAIQNNNQDSHKVIYYTRKTGGMTESNSGTLKEFSDSKELSSSLK